MAGHAWPRAAQRTTTARRPARGQRKRERPRRRGRRRTRGTKGREGEGGPKRKLIHRALHGAALARARRGQRRPKKRRRRAEKGGGQRQRSTVAPSRETETTICASRRNLPLGTAWKLWSGPSSLIYYYYYYFLWVREAALQTDTSKLLYQGPAPTREPTCSLELSLPSPAGIWFKTPLPVGGAKTASQGIGFPKESATQSFRSRECGGRPRCKKPREYPLNLLGASRPT